MLLDLQETTSKNLKLQGEIVHFCFSVIDGEKYLDSQFNGSYIYCINILACALRNFDFFEKENYDQSNAKLTTDSSQHLLEIVRSFCTFSDHAMKETQQGQLYVDNVINEHGLHMALMSILESS